MLDKKNNINNFIGIYDGYIPEEACDQAIELFKNTMNLIKLGQDFQVKKVLKIKNKINNYFVFQKY